MNTTPATINAARDNPAPQTQNFVLRVQPLVGFRSREEGAFKAALGEFVMRMDFSAQITFSIEFDALPSIRSRIGTEESLPGLLQLFRIADLGFGRTRCRVIPPCGTATRPVI
jgi:hypothetical protein